MALLIIFIMWGLIQVLHKNIVSTSADACLHRFSSLLAVAPTLFCLFTRTRRVMCQRVYSLLKLLIISVSLLTVAVCRQGIHFPQVGPSMKMKTLLPASCGKTNTGSAGDCSFSDSLQSSSSNLIPILPEERVESGICWSVPEPDVQDAEHLLWDLCFSNTPSTFLI